VDHLVGTSVLVGAYALDAMAAAQDRREQLQRAKNSGKRTVWSVASACIPTATRSVSLTCLTWRSRLSVI